MSRGYPSMTALLGLLAIAGYQNRDKISEMLGKLGGGTTSAEPHPQNVHPEGNSSGNDGGLLGNLGGLLGGASVGSLLNGGLSELMERFQKSGYSHEANSWVQPGPNKDLQPPQIEQAIGPDVLDALARQTGLSREEILARLSRELPSAVDRYTPDGRLPAA